MDTLSIYLSLMNSDWIIVTFCQIQAHGTCCEHHRWSLAVGRIFCNIYCNYERQPKTSSSHPQHYKVKMIV